MTDSAGLGVTWAVVVVRLPAQPSRHRVGVWRELRRVGAVPLGPGVWAVPDTPTFRQGLERVIKLVDRGRGDIIELTVTGRDHDDADRLTELFNAARDAEWAEFVTDCSKYEAELDREIAADKLTLAELEEEEQSFERLRRWHRDLKTRDLFGVASTHEADRRLKHCRARLDDYAERVYGALHQG